MTASELRIGNYLQWNNFTEARIMNGKDFFIVYDSLENSDGCIEPIPLTEEWLFKFGFLSNPYKDRYELIAKINIIIECDKTKGLVDLYCEQYPYIKHVHQLQNLYFALTNEELTLKQTNVR